LLRKLICRSGKHFIAEHRDWSNDRLEAHVSSVHPNAIQRRVE